MRQPHFLFILIRLDQKQFLIGYSFFGFYSNNVESAGPIFSSNGEVSSLVHISAIDNASLLVHVANLVDRIACICICNGNLVSCRVWI